MDDDYIMSSILDIDLDYFNLIYNPAQKLSKLLEWANCPISFVVENHHEVLRLWKEYFKKRHLRKPKYLLHVDEKTNPDIANFIYPAMRTWPVVRVHWLVEMPIDLPSMWLTDDAWMSVSTRFTLGSNLPRKWPKPQIFSVCTSPNFVPLRLQKELIAIIENWSILDNSSISANGFIRSAKRG